MNAITDLAQLIASMKPERQPADYVFVTVTGDIADYLTLNPLACFQEAEGLTLILEQTKADHAGIGYEGVFSQITMTVHSSLEAVGLTAAISNALAQHNISANVVAAYFHDHVFVPKENAEQALQVLQQLSREPSPC
ncbi:ACT domain-containing protein [Thalassotalea mangrovi]|uniref:ACT domain-containing protein n=1 Tax=Thalassotalea mangrovi TaxID=2572245 RepID=A0A4U1B2F2_9GAMM|nr:ACT domain-containing protein [Thalassotalea mangrovi]TKB43631.1 ACT domain-containing protein [Thalassotalea mangrovi]